MAGPFWSWPTASRSGLDMAAVLSHALAEGCAFVLFDRDGPVVEALPWRDEDGAP